MPIIFSPLWLFHAVVARGRFSLPAPKLPNDRNWAPFHAVMATPLLVAFELMLCIYLESRYVVSLKIVFAPLVALELAILFDNIRMCKALMPSDDEHVSDDVIWETLPHFWISISMVFLTAATIFTLLKINDEDQDESAGRPSVARHISIPVLFTPLLLLQGAEKILLLVHNGVFSGRYLDITSKVREYFGFFRHGSRFLGWWSIDEGSREEQARLYCAGASGYDTFSPDIVKKLPRSDLVQEIWKLQAALSEQTEITKFSQQEYERLQNLSRIIILKKLKTLAVRSVKSAPYAASPLNIDCPYIMCKARRPAVPEL
ncbi:Transmembrane Fragile-X-F-associated protein [Prunus dulcis]|uniref:Transmembrane Fragile-X-F-associated protein n=1 Tax=Prunus dulcis TaxID=3755 RepID=A0A4Y1QRD7_PRUDU|nr:Transmembrane Fragile-X-F-associated protein [Prunus dulcis]